MSAQRTVQMGTDTDIRFFWWGHPILTIITDNFSFANSSFPTACLIAIHIKLCDWMSHRTQNDRCNALCLHFDQFDLFFSQTLLLCPGATMWQPQKPFSLPTSGIVLRQCDRFVIQREAYICICMHIYICDIWDLKSFFLSRPVTLSWGNDVTRLQVKTCVPVHTIVQPSLILVSDWPKTGILWACESHSHTHTSLSGVLVLSL